MRAGYVPGREADRALAGVVTAKGAGWGKPDGWMPVRGSGEYGGYTEAEARWIYYKVVTVPAIAERCRAEDAAVEINRIAGELAGMKAAAARASDIFRSWAEAVEAFAPMTGAECSARVEALLPVTRDARPVLREEAAAEVARCARMLTDPGYLAVKADADRRGRELARERRVMAGKARQVAAGMAAFASAYGIPWSEYQRQETRRFREVSGLRAWQDPRSGR